MTTPPNLDTLLVGIDAGCLPVFERLFDEDRIPTIERICADGVSAPLTSQIPPWTPSAWPSIYTGVNPGEHGVTGFVGYDGYDWHVVNNDLVEEHSIWRILGSHDLTSVVVNAPVTHPPSEFDGALVPGFTGPENPDCHPSGLLEELREEIGEYRVYPRYTRGTQELSDAEKMEEYESLIGMRGAAFRYLTDRFTPDFGFVQFQKTDTVFHEFDGEEDKVNTVYETVDDELDAILDACDPQRIFIVSDHGIGRYGRYECRVNELLRRSGYVETTNSGKGMPSWNPIRMELREGKDVTTWEPSRTERLAAGAAELGFTAHRARVVLERLHLLGMIRHIVPSNVARTANVQVDFENSTAYMRARTEFGIRINLQGREPNGSVQQSDYDQVRQDLIEQLRALDTPDGEPVFEEVCRRDRYFDGKHADRAVDIVTVPREMDVFLSEQLGDSVFTEPEQTWDHKMDGVFVASGADIDTTDTLSEPHLFDVAPTVLAAMGVPYSDRMDGAPLPIVADSGSMPYPSYDGDPATPGATDEAVEERLADLGYLS